MLTTETLMHWARLKRIFKIAKQVDVVATLDEVDAFMERPMTAFLRNLEYYENVPSYSCPQVCSPNQFDIQYYRTPPQH